MFWKKIKKPWQKKPYRLGDRIRCLQCGAVLILVKQVDKKKEANNGKEIN